MSVRLASGHLTERGMSNASRVSRHLLDLFSAQPTRGALQQFLVAGVKVLRADVVLRKCHISEMLLLQDAVLVSSRVRPIPHSSQGPKQ
jgi:hypothetical protein